MQGVLSGRLRRTIRVKGMEEGGLLPPWMRNGLVLLADPYRDAYGRNCLPVGCEDFTTGWLAYLGATVTVTPGQLDPDGGNNAYRVQISGGSVTTKYFVNSGGAPASTGILSGACWAKVNNGVPCKLWWNAIAGQLVNISSSEWVRTTKQAAGITTNLQQLAIIALNAGDSLDITVYHPQLNLGSTLFPYSAPSGAPGTLQTATDYSGRGNNLTLGATTGASTDDPANTGAAWSFDGGDFLLANGLRDALKGKTGFTLAVVINQSNLGGSRGILSGAATASVVLGVNFCYNDASPYYPTILVNDGSTSAKAVLTEYTTGVNRLIIVRFIGGTELSIKNAGGAWVKDETNVPPYVKQSIDVDWAIGGLDIAGAIKGLVGTLPLFCAWNWPIPDSGIARVENVIKSLMASRGVTLA